MRSPFRTAIDGNCDMNELSNISGLQLTEPRSAEDWERYFDLRWSVLRAPWGQPKGSERDDREADSIHLMICDPSGLPLAVGRLHLNSPGEAQVRFMAVRPALAGRGLGSAILGELESRAIKAGVRQIVLNAREGAISFYRKHDYAVVEPAETLFESIPHVKMAKDLSSPRA